MHNSPCKIVKSYLAFWQILQELPIAKRKALWLLLLAAPLSIILLIIIPEGYDDIALFIPVPCPVPTEWSVRLPASDLVVPILVAAQGTHCSTYIVSHIVGHDVPWLLQANGVLPPPEGLFLCTKHLGETVLDFQMFSIDYHI